MNNNFNNDCASTQMRNNRPCEQSSLQLFVEQSTAKAQCSSKLGSHSEKSIEPTAKNPHLQIYDIARECQEAREIIKNRSFTTISYDDETYQFENETGEKERLRYFSQYFPYCKFGSKLLPQMPTINLPEKQWKRKQFEVYGKYDDELDALPGVNDTSLHQMPLIENGTRVANTPLHQMLRAQNKPVYQILLDESKDSCKQKPLPESNVPESDQPIMEICFKYIYADPVSFGQNTNEIDILCLEMRSIMVTRLHNEMIKKFEGKCKETAEYMECKRMVNQIKARLMHEPFEVLCAIIKEICTLESTEREEHCSGIDAKRSPKTVENYCSVREAEKNIKRCYEKTISIQTEQIRSKDVQIAALKKEVLEQKAVIASTETKSKLLQENLNNFFSERESQWTSIQATLKEWQDKTYRLEENVNQAQIESRDANQNIKKEQEKYRNLESDLNKAHSKIRVVEEKFKKEQEKYEALGKDFNQYTNSLTLTHIKEQGEFKRENSSLRIQLEEVQKKLDNHEANDIIDGLKIISLLEKSNKQKRKINLLKEKVRSQSVHIKTITKEQIHTLKNNIDMCEKIVSAKKKVESRKGFDMFELLVALEYANCGALSAKRKLPIQELVVEEIEKQSDDDFEKLMDKVKSESNIVSVGKGYSIFRDTKFKEKKDEGVENMRWKKPPHFLNDKVYYTVGRK
uniref:RING-type domain-containing protein n=1 Tax=Rhabditophanes sp. KR3021 TaxID=114890 RepID=A0AC35TGN2_9BILA